MAEVRDSSLDYLKAGIDLPSWEALRKETLNKFGTVEASGWEAMERVNAKYFDLDTWLHFHRRHARQLGLDNIALPIKILDIACGAGIFLYICKRWGHVVEGFDVPSEMYKAMARQLDVPFHSSLVHKMKPMEDRFTGYDLITSISVKFDRLDWARTTEESWGVTEWEYFLKDAGQRLNEGGHMYLKPNKTASGELFDDPRVLDMFQERATDVTDTWEFIFPKTSLI